MTQGRIYTGETKEEATDLLRRHYDREIERLCKARGVARPQLGIGNRTPGYALGVGQGQTDLPPGGAIEGPAHTWPNVPPGMVPSGPPIPQPAPGRPATPVHPHPVGVTFNGNGTVPVADPTSPYPQSCGVCVAAGNACEYDPALFCGWSALPFSTYKSQGDKVGINTGPVTANWAAMRMIEITAERACTFRIRGLWMRSINESDLALGISLLMNTSINDNPKVLEIGDASASDRRIGIPTSMFDGPFWVLPTDWGTVGPINNESRPLKLYFGTPESINQHIIGCLFGDPIKGGVSIYGNVMVSIN